MIIVSQDSRVSSALTSLMVIITASSILIQPPNSTVQAFVKTTEQPINRGKLLIDLDATYVRMLSEDIRMIWLPSQMNNVQ